MPTLLNEQQLLWRKVQEAVKCPYCHAPTRAFCRNYKAEQITRPHSKRIRLYEAEHGAVDYLKRIRKFSPEDAKVIDELAKAKVFFYEGPGVIMPSGRRVNGNQMRLLVAAAGYNPLQAPHSFEERGAGLSEIVRSGECTGANDGTCPKHPKVTVDRSKGEVVRD